MDHLEYDAPGGLIERVRVPLETEAWRMLREGVADPGIIDHLSRTALGIEEGLLSRIRRDGPLERADVVRDLTEATMGDARFRPLADVFPPEGPGSIWEMLDDSAEPFADGIASELPEKVLVIGTPHLAELWQNRIYEGSKGQSSVEIWPLWDMTSVQEEDWKRIVKSGPWDVLVEVLVGPGDERRALLELLAPQMTKNGQVWVHTLNLPATVTVQVVPENLVAVGFGGIPNRSGEPSIELMLPRNSDASDLVRAAGTASALGMVPYEISDEPGGVGARLLATLINSTSYLVREGIVASEGVADREVKNSLELEEGPFAIADEIGLDTVEGVTLGLRAHLGEERYRVCPMLTMRIEAGQLGRTTNGGFYVP